ncbi:M23 family metallopeptidase [Patescibacteria group bacterium]|nr:M23 family metallopeptidase [Patescibacteria group bacterium]
MKIFRSLRKLFGFTRNGTSIVGKYARLVLRKRELKRPAGVGIVALTTAVILIHNLSNIGGSAALAVSGPVAPLIDATTKASIQKPINYDVETRGFSWFHTGADLAAPTGTQVRAIMTGTVVAVNHELFGYGNHIIIDHAEGLESLYGHLSRTEVEPGQKVNAGEEIGLSGSTGFSTGPHLHLEIHQNGQLINPADIVPGVN